MIWWVACWVLSAVLGCLCLYFSKHKGTVTALEIVAGLISGPLFLIVALFQFGDDWVVFERKQST